MAYRDIVDDRPQGKPQAPPTPLAAEAELDRNPAWGEAGTVLGLLMCVCAGALDPLLGLSLLPLVVVCLFSSAPWR